MTFFAVEFLHDSNVAVSSNMSFKQNIEFNLLSFISSNSVCR